MKLLRWIPFAMLLRSSWLCRRGHQRVAIWKLYMGADTPAGFWCPKCDRRDDLNGRFLDWFRERGAA